MLGAAALSEVPLSSEAGASLATFAMTGTGQFASVGAASTRAILAATGSGTLTAIGAATGSASFSLAGVGSLSAVGISSATTAFAIIGSAAFTAYGEPIYRTPAYRTAVVPLVSRGLVIQGRSRIEVVPAPTRVLTVLATSPRMAIVPAYGNTIEAS